MDKIEPEGKGWTGITYYYKLNEGWYEDSSWLIPNKKKVLEQFYGIDKAVLKEVESVIADE
ncbi:hypothetical protein PWEIH_14966 [Listeria weihenstephanensis FSL R9-0317]|uniref:hypothetical protein n=1 Tax=Listeria weihenstephanensis TaxID=1006155 RepID=UPI0003E86FCC|nr:hypothetical protein [Listeria weihenstephanensis]EUJ35855.1 hypothetical protein PWEIH_14966 [Listeria weihenstephanensis FSL R9-0317]